MKQTPDKEWNGIETTPLQMEMQYPLKKNEITPGREWNYVPQWEWNSPGKNENFHLIKTLAMYKQQWQAVAYF